MRSAWIFWMRTKNLINSNGIFIESFATELIGNFQNVKVVKVINEAFLCERKSVRNSHFVLIYLVPLLSKQEKEVGFQLQIQTT